MGDRDRAGEADPHECYYDVHVRQQPANLQYHDGVYVVQGPDPGTAGHELRVCQVRQRGDAHEADWGQDCLCVGAVWASGLGGLEGQWDGAFAVCCLPLFARWTTR